MNKKILFTLFLLTIFVGCTTGALKEANEDGFLYDSDGLPIGDVPGGDSDVANIDTVNDVNNPTTREPLHIEIECAHGPQVGDCGGTYSGTEFSATLENNDTTIGYFEHGNYVSFSNIDLTGLNTLTINYAKGVTGGELDIRIDSANGTKIGSFNPNETAGWTNFQQLATGITSVEGVHSIYLVADYIEAVGVGVLNLDWFSLSQCTNGDCPASDVTETPVDTGAPPDVDTGSNDNGEGLPPIVGGSSGSTTRYWDCCKPHCGWHSTMKMCNINNQRIWDYDAQSSCDGGSAYQCWDYSPIKVNDKVSYGWAAFNSSSTPCGECYQLDFKGDMYGKQMIVQVVNIGDGGGNAFDILIPGGGVGQFDGCSKQWGYPNLGETYGGFRSTCGDNASCVRSMCQAAFGSKTELMNGCEWFIGWFKNSNNPDVTFKKTTCPSAITNVSGI